MEFRKTHVLPQDQAAARHLFERLVYDEPFVLFIVVGDGPHAEQLVSKAGKFAGSDADPRRVVWARSLAPIADVVQTFHDRTANWKAKVLASQAQAFLLSVGDEIRDGFAANEPFDNVRVWEAWRRAESP